MDKIILRMAIAVCFIGIISCSTPPKQINLAEKPVEKLALQGDNIAIWHKLQLLSLNKLRTYAAETKNSRDTAWLKLVIISKQYSSNTSELLTQLLTWRDTYPH